MLTDRKTIAEFDPEIWTAIEHERTRQEGHIELIASENYTSPRVLEAVGKPADARVTVDSWTVFDLNVSYDLTEQTLLQLSVRNLFDEEPPEVLGSSANVDHINHDSMGRFITLRATYQF